MSFSSILSASVQGLKVEFIHVEADVSNGLPVFHMVGYLSSEVEEAAERVRTAIRNAGMEFPAKRISGESCPGHGAEKRCGIRPSHRIGMVISLGHLVWNGKGCW